MKIILISRIDDRDALQYTEQMGRLLSGWGHDISFDQTTADAIGERGCRLEESDATLAVVIGGDGTILHSVQRMVQQKPVLGINWGEVGFLADIEPVEAEKFLREMEPGFPIERRMRLILTRDGEILGSALNEALIITSRPAKMLRENATYPDKGW